MIKKNLYNLYNAAKKQNLKIFLVTAAVFLLILNSSAEKIYVVEINDAITPSTVELIEEALNEKPYILVLNLDTPGGDLDSTLKIIERIDNSEVPVIGYVSPRGAHAWSAGTFILLSTHISAMAPNSVIGSCQPVYIGGGSETFINESKIINALVSIMKERMNMHNRNSSLAEKFITENLNLNAEEAKNSNVIEFVSADLESLITSIDGKKINTTKEIKLNTKNAEIVYYHPSLKVAFMGIVSNPIIASLLLIIGIYAIIFGVSSPGIGAEVFGAVFLLLGLIGMGFDVNIVGIMLILIGVALIIYELFSGAFGLAGVIGIISLFLGIIFLGPLSSPKFYVSKEFFDTVLYATIVPTVVFGVFLFYALIKILKLRKQKPVIGEGILGETAEAVDDINENSQGFVLYNGELWKATSTHKIKKGDEVRVINKKNYVLVVEPKNI